MGFFENRRIKKRIEELEFERYKLEQQRKKIQPAFDDLMRSYYKWQSERRKNPFTDAPMPVSPDISSEYTAICFRLVEIDEQIEDLKAQIQ